MESKHIPGYTLLVENIKKYIISSIKNTMLTRYNIKYTEQNSSTIYNVDGQSFMQGQWYYDDANRVVYVYLNLDPNCKWGRTDRMKEMYTNIAKDLHDNARSKINNEVECIAWNRSLHNSDKCLITTSTDTLASDTISYWKSQNNKYEFIRNNKVLMYEANKISSNKDNVLETYKSNVKAINDKYDFISDNFSIPTAFDEYRALYKSTFGKELIEIDSSDIVSFSLFNYSDWSIFDNKNFMS